jgi:hypothetical protein
VELVRERWWEGRWPGNLRVENNIYVYVNIKIIEQVSLNQFPLIFSFGMLHVLVLATLDNFKNWTFIDK